MSQPPTDRQRLLLRIVYDFTQAKGYPPSVRDISAAMQDISTNAVANHISACIKKGYITKAPHIARSIQVTLAGRNELSKVE